MKGFAGLLLAAAIALPASAQDNSVPKSVYDAVGKLFNGRTPTEVTKTPLPGLFEVLLGSDVYYISGDGNYLLRGDLYDLDQRRNLTDSRRSTIRKAALDKLDPSELIVFEPKEKRYTVTVFTDVDCGYCAKLHSEIQAYLDEGIEIRYAAFPRAGVPSKTYDTMVSVWCAADKQKALTDAKARRPVAEAQCANPVEKQYELGSTAFGVSGTPTLVLENGDVIPGYVPPARLPLMIQQHLGVQNPGTSG